MYNHAMPPKQFTATVTGKRQLTPSVFEIDFTGDFTFAAGQFVSIVVPAAASAAVGGPNRDIRRAYSIASGPADPVFQLSVKLVDSGPGTNYLKSLNTGDLFTAYAPYGDFVCKTAKDRTVVFISTGTGIAPFRSMLHDPKFWEGRTAPVITLFGSRDTDEILYQDELSGFNGNKYILCLSRPTQIQDPEKPDHHNGKKFFKGRVTDWLRSGGMITDGNFGGAGLSADWPATTEFYMCGSNQMIDEVKLILGTAGVPKTSLHQEIYYKVKPEEAAAK